MSDDETEFRIEFSITRRLPGEDDFTEVGFGSSGAWADLDMCTHMVESAVTRGEWQITAGMPTPESVMSS